VVSLEAAVAVYLAAIVVMIEVPSASADLL
jgi:hypothetical protein